MDKDQYGYAFAHPATIEDQRREMQRYFEALGIVPTYSPCGSCGAYHPKGYSGDCRNG